MYTCKQVENTEVLTEVFIFTARTCENNSLQLLWIRHFRQTGKITVKGPLPQFANALQAKGLSRHSTPLKYSGCTDKLKVWVPTWL